MSRARRAAKPKLGDVVSVARVRYVKVGPRKVRDVVDLLRGLSLSEAQRQLGVIHRPSSVPMLVRLLKSAFSNANQNLDGGHFKPEDLIVGEITVDGGPVTGRFRPRAMGRATPIRRRISHVTVKLHRHP